jgi:hypothetical protein
MLITLVNPSLIILPNKIKRKTSDPYKITGFSLQNYLVNASIIFSDVLFPLSIQSGIPTP